MSTSTVCVPVEGAECGLFDTPLAEAEGILNSATDLKMFCQERQFLNLSTVGIPPIDEPNSETSQRIYLQKRTRIFP